MSNVYYSQHSSTIGILYIAATNEGVCNILLPGQCEQDLVTRLNKHFDTINRQDNRIIMRAKIELDEYFNGTRKEFTVPLKLIGTEFQKKVWNQLLKIPYGMTMSYGEIAAAIGNPKAGRAVGGANNKNPVPIIVPCHRVIGADGSLVGYGSGLDLKRKLLAIEGII